ncbi:hypothetical protein [Pseudonocardia sp. NPDC049635]|uniref:hypothetical protein n=1 Tax=Pseudonocardia sp. NPDC049635 TaxID=3155506 RepID=UPI0033DC4B78
MTGLVSDDDGTPLAGVYVAAELVGSRWLADQTGQIDGRQDTYTGVDGRWTLDLLGSDRLAVGAYWRVRVWQRATFGLNVPPRPDDDRLVDISEPGVLRPDTPEPPDEEFALGDLADVRTDGAQPGQVLVRGADGVWYPENPPTGGAQWGDAVAFSATEPDPDTAPASAVWVELGPELRIYRKAP